MPQARKQEQQRSSVFSAERELVTPHPQLPSRLKLNKPLQMDGRELLKDLPADCITAVFFDPQYRGILDKMQYGNEGQQREKARCALRQMRSDDIIQFIQGIEAVLIPSGHLFLWIDKFHLCQGSVKNWIEKTSLGIVDLITWDKGRIGMGYRTRRKSEYLVVLQKRPLRAKGVWSVHNIPDVHEEIPEVWKEIPEIWEEVLEVWEEKVKRNGYPHNKPIGLQTKLIEAVSNPKDIIVDPAAGSFSVMEACRQSQRNFLGCDIQV